MCISNGNVARLKGSSPSLRPENLEVEGLDWAKALSSANVEPVAVEYIEDLSSNLASLEDVDLGVDRGA